jgi:hypothetical protein
MHQRHEHLPRPTPLLPHVVLDDRVAALEAVLVAKPLEDPLGRMALLAVGSSVLFDLLRRMTLLAVESPILFEDAVDDAGERIQLRPPRWLGSRQ